MTKDRLWYRAEIVLQISKLISDRFREIFLHYQEVSVSRNLDFSMRNCLVKIFLKTTRELNCYKSDGKLIASGRIETPVLFSGVIPSHLLNRSTSETFLK